MFTFEYILQKNRFCHCDIGPTAAFILMLIFDDITSEAMLNIYRGNQICDVSISLYLWLGESTGHLKCVA